MSDLIKGNHYTTRVAMRVHCCKERCLHGDTSGNPALPQQREITNGTRMVLHYEDTFSGYSFLVIEATQEAVRVASSYLIPWA